MEKDKQIIVYTIIGIGGLVLLSKLYKRMQQNKKLTANFKWSEFESKDGATMPADVKANVQELAKNLEVIRAAVGGPITINSGYRSPAHNKSVGGAKNSQHLYGRAADIKAKNLNTHQLHTIIEDLIAKGKIKQGGLGLYPSWVHYDIRGTQARW